MPETVMPPGAIKGVGQTCSAGFQTCCVADFQVGWLGKNPMRQHFGRPAGLETRDTAGLETCATSPITRRARQF
jgi:hypothetical protein